MSTLVVLAAGMGSRFGGLKQMQAVDEAGRALLDYTVNNAVKVGFDNAVFVVRKDMYDDFRQLVGNRLSQSIHCEYAFQGDDVYKRSKPLGTAHALLCCRCLVKEPFAVVNADDYYGRQALSLAYKHLSNASGAEFAMVGYDLCNTLSVNGCVSRGVCKIRNGFLESVSETANIDCNCVIRGGTNITLSPETVVSMNLWAFTPVVFDLLDEGYEYFMSSANTLTDEYQLPTVISSAVTNGRVTVRAYVTADKWYGLTYRQDLPLVRQALTKM